MQKKFALRSQRSGTGVLPPNPKQWENEHNGLDIRHDLGLSHNALLDHKCVFGLLPNVLVLPHSELELPGDVAQYFSGQRSNRWSGMCVPCPTGETMVIYNAFHPIRRIRATLMEEFFHLWLEHPPTKLRRFATRDFDATKESEAYGSGAAALVPYLPLKQMLLMGHSVTSISEHFNVSAQLIDFRLKVTRLIRLAKKVAIG